MVAVNYQRTLFHICGGLFGTLIALIFPFPEIVVISGTFFGIAVIAEIARGRSHSFHEDFVHRFTMIMKPTERGTLLGFTWITSAALLLTFLQDQRPMVLGMLIWTFADPMAMLAGNLLPRVHSVAKGKTIEGFLAFFLTATLISVLYFTTVQVSTPIAVVAPVIGLIAAFTELLSRVIRVDDNFSTPLIVGLVTYFFVI